MKRAWWVISFALLLSTAALAQTVTLHTMYGPVAANADRVMVSGEDGRWSEVVGSGGTYLVELEGSRYSLAVTCFANTGPHITVYRFLADELPTLRHVCPGRGPVLADTTSFTGEIRAGAQPSEGIYGATVQLGPRQLFSGVVQGSATFSASGVPSSALEGAADLLALYGPLGEAPTLALLERGAALTAGTAGAIGADGATELFDFGADAALPLQHHELTVTEAERATLAARLITCTGLSADVAAAVPAGTQASSFAALPSSAARECDRYELTAFATDASGFTLRLASVSLAEPGSYAFEFPEPVAQPVIETVGTDPLRARFTWQAEPGVLLYLGGLTDGRVTWNFVQSPWLAPSITLPPWGAGVGVPDVRGGHFNWGFGAVRSAGAVGPVLHAYSQHSLTGHGQFWSEVEAGLEFSVYLTGGTWAPHATELPGSR